jgi:hypothetical protein
MITLEQRKIKRVEERGKNHPRDLHINAYKYETHIHDNQIV